MLWDRLKKISKLEFISTSTRVYKNLYTNGEGNIQVSVDMDERINFLESGQWLTSQHKKLEFTNHYRWTKNTDKNYIVLEHLRYGKNNAVNLAHLLRDGNSTWKSAEPHRCNEDLYSVVIGLNKKNIEMKWRIVGPKKNQTIITKYF